MKTNELGICSPLRLPFILIGITVQIIGISVQIVGIGVQIVGIGVFFVKIDDLEQLFIFIGIRMVLLRMHRDGLIELSPPKQTGVGGKPKDLAQVADTDWPSALIELPQDLRQVAPVAL